MWRNSSKLILVLLAMAVRASAVAAWAESPPEVGEIVRGIEHCESLLFNSRSLLVEYERTSSVDVNKSVASGGYLPTAWKMAYQGTMWYLERRFTRPGGTGNPGDPLIPKDPRIDLLRDDVLLEWEGTDHEVLIDHFKKGRNIFAGLFYTRHLSLERVFKLVFSRQAT